MHHHKGSHNSLAVEINNVRYAYPNAERPAVSIEHWTVPRRHSVFVHGASGSGKSTLIHLLAGLVKPDEGVINIGAQCISKLSASQCDRFRSRHVGLVYQQFNLIPYLTALDNVRLAAALGKKKLLAKERAQQLLEQMGLTVEQQHLNAGQLSVGQQQRVAIARSMINEPELLLMDEPTSALDDGSVQRFMEVLFQGLQDFGGALVFVSHDLSLAPTFDQQLSLAELNVLGEHQC